ncbi:MAG: glycosyltransferase family 4 protein [Pseudomonadota bacterium]
MNRQQSSRGVLSITAKFPNVVQPWFVNQLIGIQANGGRNRILARRAQLDLVSREIRDHGLLDRCEWIPGNSVRLLFDWLISFVLPSRMGSAWRGLFRFRRVVSASVLSTREKLYGLLLCRFYGYDDVDIVHSHSEVAGSKLLPIIIGLDVPVVATFHGLTPEGVPELSERRREAYIAIADQILVNTDAAKQQYIALGAPPEKMRIVPQGIPLDQFPFVHRHAPRSEEPLEILSIGRLDVSKGQQYTIEAVRQLKADGLPVKLHLVGDGPARQEYARLVESGGLTDEVVFHGLLVDQDLRAVFERCHVLVLASLGASADRWQETQGVVLQEAQASGLLVIATRTGGIPECIDDGRAGFLIEDRSAQAIADALKRVLAHPDRWQEWQVAGRDWVESRFSSEVIGKQMTAIYNEHIRRSQTSSQE